MLAESTKASIFHEKEVLQQELDVAREQLKHLQRHHDEFEMKSKADMKLLIKEVKSLRSSQLELKQQLSELMKEKIDVEVWSSLVNVYCKLILFMCMFFTQIDISSYLWSIIIKKLV